MKTWEDLTLIQKAIIGIAIIAVAAFAPEIALLVHFGGIEVAFAFLLFFFRPILSWLQHAYTQLNGAVQLAVISLRHSASMQPKVFVLQAAFCCAALLLTGSVPFAFSFFMPGMLLNGALT